MKKLIAILTIAIVLVGAVFAANSPDAKTANGSTEIVVTAKIKEDIPQFQLAIKSGNIETPKAAAIAAGTVGDDGTTVTAANMTSTKAALTDDAITALGTANGSVTIGFAINQIAPANLKASYTITVTATDLLLKKHSDGTVISSGQTSTQKFLVDNTENTTTGATPAVTANSTAVSGLKKTAGTGTNAHKLTVEYEGTAKVDAGDGATGNAAVVELGTFSVKWLANTTAVAGDYEAEVKIEVTST